MVKVLKEFREFAMKGSVVDLAVGVIIGSAFGKIVASLVADIVMPPVSFLLGGVDFANKFVTLRGGQAATLKEAKEIGAVTWNYGLFLNTVLEFLIVAFAVFFMIKQVNRLRRAPAAAPPPSMRACPDCLTEIPRAARRCKSCGIQTEPM